MPQSAESIHKVHDATKSTLVTPLSLDIEVLVPSSFQSNGKPLTTGKINGMLLRSGLISKFSVKSVSPSPRERSEHDQKFCKLAQHSDEPSRRSRLLSQSPAFPYLCARSVCNLCKEYGLVHHFSPGSLIFSGLFQNSKGHVISRTLSSETME